MQKRFSDITVSVRTEEFHLNKIVLSKIPFFDKAFNGSFLDEKIICLDLDVSSFKNIVHQIYDTGKIVVKTYNKEMFEVLSFLGCNDTIDEYERKMENSIPDITEEDYEYCIMSPRLQKFVSQSWLRRLKDPQSPIVKTYQMLKCDSIREIIGKREEPYVKVALDMFFREEIGKMIDLEEEDKDIDKFLIIYDVPLEPYVIICKQRKLKRKLENISDWTSPCNSFKFYIPE